MDNKNSLHDLRLFQGMTDEEKIEAEAALKRYFDLMLRVAEERVAAQNKTAPPLSNEVGTRNDSEL